MFGTTLAISALQTSEFFGTGRNPRKLGSAHPRNAPYQAYAASDGWFVIAAGNNRLWQQVCAVTNTPELLADARFATPSLRAQHQVELKELLDPHFARRTVGQWLQGFAGAGVPCAPINGYREALDDPQTHHLQLVQPQTLPGGHLTHTVVSPVRMDGHTLAVDTRPPSLGEHGDVIRAALTSGKDPL
jgi:crotonobetainyl-CoA:carnitine CoA-transferase CaiB-like acyl-CoA transferase